jgi:hypothetical protein
MRLLHNKAFKTVKPTHACKNVVNGRSIFSKIIFVERISVYFIKLFDDEYLVFVGVLE